MICPKCKTSEMYNNLLNKKNPKGPDYVCKNKECGGAIWESDSTVLLLREILLELKKQNGENSTSGF